MLELRATSLAGTRRSLEYCMRALLAGWFSFPEGSATAGDVSAAVLAQDWLGRAGIPSDLAVAPPFVGDVQYDSVDPADYTHAIFVCGPFGGAQIVNFLHRFAHCRLIGLNLTVAYPSASWEPFDLVIARDSESERHADMVFSAPAKSVPLVGMVFVEEYDGADTVGPANTLRRVLTMREAASFDIDTRLDHNLTGLRTPAEVESAIARMDVVLTTRLHGLVLALKHGVPVIAIDPDPRICKLLRQGEVLGWPLVYSHPVSDTVLEEAFDYCLTAEARERASETAARGRYLVDVIANKFVTALTESTALDVSFAARRADASPRRSPTPPDIGRLAAWPLPIRQVARSFLALAKRVGARRRWSDKKDRPGSTTTAPTDLE